MNSKGFIFTDVLSYGWGVMKANFGFFVGLVMKATRGKANPKIVNEILRQMLEE